MKKFISILLIISMLAVCFVSCDDSDRKDNDDDNSPSGSSMTEIDDARSLIEQKNYSAAYEKLKTMGENEEAKKLLERFSYRPETITVSNGESEKIEYVYSYNDNGTPARILGYESGAVIEEIQFSYDTSTARLKSVNLMSTGSHTLYSCEYSADGKLVKEFDFEFGEYEYIYDGNGNVVDKIKIDGGVDMTKYEREVSFDASGRIVSETRTYGNGAKERFEYKYGANGKVAEETFTNFYGDKSRYEYTYDSEGELIGILEQFDGLLLFSATCTLKLIYCNVDMPEATEKYFSLRYLASSVRVDADAQPSGTTAPSHPGDASNPADDPEWDETVSPETEYTEPEYTYVTGADPLWPEYTYPEYTYAPETDYPLSSPEVTTAGYPSWDYPECTYPEYTYAPETDYPLSSPEVTTAGYPSWDYPEYTYPEYPAVTETSSYYPSW